MQASLASDINDSVAKVNDLLHLYGSFHPGYWDEIEPVLIRVEKK